ncbi:FAD binding domain protein [Pseudovirgaria hyperparasitica]|uniref:FAD binding domain protein n=1 Tax=Pseudovirgaria hyperparasitica TaxID=470096 RepID=A0A6A6WCY9_9PEZI|nr:FAD binding domain protein [Pseudovirgaria hyperparasitica]KAF2759924.1 FAD binding domain protein [Pseudovirgaria hyperparasitica]
MYFLGLISEALHFVLFIYLASSVPGTYSAPTNTCRCFPGDACWPTSDKWHELNTTVNGRLISTVPLASPCHDSEFGPYDEDACQAIQEAWTLPETHINSSSSIMAPTFANQSCDPFTPREQSCILGTYIQYAIDAREMFDYKAAIRFANRHNVRLVIRNTGHDWLGKSTGAGALGLWTHHLKYTEILDYESDYYTGKALKVGAGVQLMDAFRVTHDEGLVTVGGTCPSVGLAGGYVQGTGHGLLASKFGLGADQALEWEVVTASGDFIVASPAENADLYWALSGGGAASYGAVWSLTLQVHPDDITSASNLTWSMVGVDEATFYKGVEIYLEHLPTLLDAGISCNWLSTNSTFIVSPAVGHGMGKAGMDALHSTLLQDLSGVGINYTYLSREFPTFLDMYEAMNPLTETSSFDIGSRLIPRRVLRDNPSGIAETMQSLQRYGIVFSGVSFNVSKPSKSPNAVNQAWRESYVSLVVGTFHDRTNRVLNTQNLALMTNDIIPEIDLLMPDSKYAYGNEGDPFEPEWQSVFYGENYGQLLQVKQKYDPTGLFYARTAVGSEVWTEANDGRLCRSLDVGA